jgi:hypothetical protein
MSHSNDIGNEFSTLFNQVVNHAMNVVIVGEQQIKTAEIVFLSFCFRHSLTSLKNCLLQNADFSL